MINLLEILLVDLFMGNWFPEEERKIEGKVTACSKTAAHEDTDIFEEAEMIGAVGFGVDNPLWFMLAGLMPVIRGWDE